VASAAFLQMVSGGLTNPAGMERLRTALRVYCERDTLALVEVHRALLRLAELMRGNLFSVKEKTVPTFMSRSTFDRLAGIPRRFALMGFPASRGGQVPCSCHGLGTS
jgi:hypothetical protein